MNLDPRQVRTYVVALLVALAVAWSCWCMPSAHARSTRTTYGGVADVRTVR